MPEYGAAAKLLHHLALGIPLAGEMQFDIECALHGGSAKTSGGGAPVFVAGLARAGTTILMRSIHDSGQFASLTYRDMPFVLAPNSWAAVHRDRSISGHEAERAHGDGILVSVDSPETLEEVYWRIFCGRDYIRRDRLLPHAAHPDAIEGFRTYAALVRKRYRRARYLSKNNNNILRIPSIIEAFPDCQILIPFRDPFAQAASLLRQHSRFQEIHHRDPFSRKYMGWLVHHEFGSDHRPFIFGDSDAVQSNGTTIEYWLRRWDECYTYLLDRFEDNHRNVVFVCYEDLCSANSWSALSSVIGLPAQSSSDFRLVTPQARADNQASLSRQCSRTYERALAASRRRLSSHGNGS